MTNSQKHCPRCQRELKPDAPEGLCPACLMEINLQSSVTGSGAHGKADPWSLDEVARRFPELEILGLIGAGGMGIVYKARQRELDRLVALKILPHTRADAGFVERFTREAKMLARLSHPNIVTVYEFGQRRSRRSDEAEEGGEEDAENLFFLIMELVDGVTLRDLLSEGKLKPEQALTIVPPICEALQCAHEKGVIHRDIKPENILIDKAGVVKVADFGIARMTEAGREENLTEAGQVIGTAHYMAPEQVERPAEVDHRADIYALGVVFYEMLTGELPLGKFPQPSKRVRIDVRLDEVVLKALEKEPEQRYQQASEVETAVANLSTSSAAGISVDHASRYNPWETTFIACGTIFFVVLFVALLEGAGTIPFTASLLALALLGLGICALSIAGWWPFPSPWFPEPNFSFRNLGKRTGGSEGDTHAPRVSRLAVVGVVWAALCWIALPLMFTQRAVPAEEVSSAPGWSLILILPLAVLGATAPFGSTTLGWMAMGQIQRSGGRIYGFGLAFFDAVFFPVLILIGLIGWFWWWFFDGVIRSAIVAYMADQNVEAGLIVTPLLGHTGGLAVGFTAISGTLISVPLLKAIWRKTGIVESSGTSELGAHAWRRGAWLTTLTGVGIVVAVLMSGNPPFRETADPALISSHEGQTITQTAFDRSASPSAERPAPPVVIRTVPDSGASGVDPNLTELRVTFSKPMRDDSWSWVSTGQGPQITESPRYLPDGRTCVLPVTLEPGKVYALWINRQQYNAFRDTEGRSAVPYLLVFETHK